jgi:nicotinate-nucleotide--dimethylbenzimidazole phosphoribosyltransferase
MTWNQPVPLLGDVTSAAERAAEVEGWAFPAAAREAFYEVLGARRDVRRFRPAQVDPGLVRRVLTAAHMAPSVGHSEPWRFIVVSDPATRDRAARMADEQRLRQARRMEADAARRMLDLQLEGIREAPIGVVVASDRRTAPAGVLGRATFPDADLLRGLGDPSSFPLSAYLTTEACEVRQDVRRGRRARPGGARLGALTAAR